jgi:phage terminase Nu1 subunit (DNA packaging protein)
LAQAAREFDVAKDTLRRRLGECHQEPGADGCYSTKQLTLGLYGDLYGAKLRVQNEQAEKLRIENEISRGELLNRRELARCFAQIAEAMSARIMSCTELPRLAREDILRDLSSWPLALAETADRQTRLPRGNGAEEK